MILPSLQVLNQSMFEQQGIEAPEVYIEEPKIVVLMPSVEIYL